LLPEQSHKTHSSFFEIEAKTSEKLKRFLPLVEKVMPDILLKFYNHIQKFPELSRIFGPPEKQKIAMAHAAAEQEKHWRLLFSGNFDQHYVDSVRKVGRIHALKGVEPAWYIGGYAFVSKRLYEAILDEYFSVLTPDAGHKETVATITAVNQAIMLDIALAISVYNDATKDHHVVDPAELIKGIEATVAFAASSLLSSAKSIAEHGEALLTVTEDTRKRLLAGKK
jgi:hypothetical protein